MLDIDINILLKTIKIPKNILFLTEKLPQANYCNEKSIEFRELFGKRNSANPDKSFVIKY